MEGEYSVPLSWRYRVALAVLACLQNSLVGGLVYGWASIMPMLTGSVEDGGGVRIVAARFVFQRLFTLWKCHLLTVKLFLFHSSGSFA
jgi:hypothetical protein